MDEAACFAAPGGQAGDGECGLGHANTFRGRLVSGLKRGGMGYFLPKRLCLHVMIARIAARSSVILDDLSTMVRCRVVQKIIPFHNFKVLHPGSPISLCRSLFPKILAVS